MRRNVILRSVLAFSCLEELRSKLVVIRNFKASEVFPATKIIWLIDITVLQYKLDSFLCGCFFEFEICNNCKCFLSLSLVKTSLHKNQFSLICKYSTLGIKIWWRKRLEPMFHNALCRTDFVHENGRIFKTNRDNEKNCLIIKLIFKLWIITVISSHACD